MVYRTVWSHDIQLPAAAASSARARDFVGRHLLEHDLINLVDDVRLVVCELATNATVHAQTPFTVTLQASVQSVLLRVHDGSQYAPVLATAALLDTGGRGMTIVDLLSSDWGVTVHPDDGKSVWAAFQHSMSAYRAARSASCRESGASGARSGLCRPASLDILRGSSTAHPWDGIGAAGAEPAVTRGRRC